jgi:hypothetical protein
MVSIRRSPSTFKKDSGRKMESRSAPLGREMKAALPPDTMLSTCALDAVPPLMEPRSALEHRRKNLLTPYIADHWE